MSDYLTNTEYATEHLISIIGEEDKRLRHILNTRHLTTEMERELFESMKEKDDFTPEGAMLLFEYHTFAEKLDSDAAALAEELITIEYSKGFLAGALLQIAKQGISITYGSLSNCPPGRSIGRQTLKNVVWQARNQSMHFDESSYNQSVTNCFNNLRMDYGDEFILGNKNLAFRIISLLGWNNYENYKTDMNSLLI